MTNDSLTPETPPSPVASEGVVRPELIYPASTDKWRTSYDGKGMHFASEANAIFDAMEAAHNETKRRLEACESVLSDREHELVGMTGDRDQLKAQVAALKAEMVKMREADQRNGEAVVERAEQTVDPGTGMAGLWYR